MRANYSAYERDYYKQQEKLNKKGLSMRSGKLSRRDYEATYRAIRNDLKNEVLEGKRKVIGNVNQQLVRAQAYEYNPRQARAIKTAAKETGQSLTYTEIRAGQFDWTAINDYYREIMKTKKITSKEASKEIGVVFFGSPE